MQKFVLFYPPLSAPNFKQERCVGSVAALFRVCGAQNEHFWVSARTFRAAKRHERLNAGCNFQTNKKKKTPPQQEVSDKCSVWKRKRPGVFKKSQNRHARNKSATMKEKVFIKITDYSVINNSFGWIKVITFIHSFINNNHQNYSFIRIRSCF